jgi:segregation and condensation protein B
MSNKRKRGKKKDPAEVPADEQQAEQTPAAQEESAQAPAEPAPEATDAAPADDAPPPKRKRGKKAKSSEVSAGEQDNSSSSAEAQDTANKTIELDAVNEVLGDGRVVVSEVIAASDTIETSAIADEAAAEEESTEPPADLEALTRTVEALLFAAEEPIAPREIARASGSNSATIRKVLKSIKDAYDQEKRPWDVIEVANGYRLATRAEFFPAIQRLKTQTAQRKLTQAALETLALIAYRQPIGRAEVESVRGVGAGPVLRQLLDKKLIKIAGRGTGLGQPLLYGTTDYFLEHFGLRSTAELPKPGEFKNT